MSSPFPSASAILRPTPVPPLPQYAMAPSISSAAVACPPSLIPPASTIRLEVSNRVRAEEAKGNNKRGESLLLSPDPANNNDNKDENALSALTNAATMSGQPPPLSR